MRPSYFKGQQIIFVYFTSVYRLICGERNKANAENQISMYHRETKNYSGNLYAIRS